MKLNDEIQRKISQLERLRDEKHSHITGWTTRLELWEDKTFYIELYHKNCRTDMKPSYSFFYLSSGDEFFYSEGKTEKILISDLPTSVI